MQGSLHAQGVHGAPPRSQRALHVCSAKRRHKLAPASNKQQGQRKPAGPQKASDVLQDKLGACSVIFCGDNGALNDSVAKEFGKHAGYAPLTTSNLINEVSGLTVDELKEKEGRDFVVITEASVLEQLSAMLRCSIGTLGGGWAAAARGDNWRHMFGAFNVWLDVHPEQQEKEAPQRGAYSKAEVHLKLGMPEGFSADDAAEEVVAQVVPALMDVVAKQDDIATGKKLYMKLGCRGDWPKLKPPDWQPPDAQPAQDPDVLPADSQLPADEPAKTITVPTA